MVSLPPSQIVPARESVAYGVGGTAAAGLFLASGAFQPGFHSDAFGLTAAAAGTLLLAIRVGGAVFDPVMGMITDRVPTWWGRFRPWLLWSAAPMGLAGLLACAGPCLGSEGKIMAALAAPALLALAFSAGSLPYFALGAVMTYDRNERTRLSIPPFVFALLAVGVFHALAQPLVKAFGHGDDVRGRQMTVGLLSILGAVAYLVAYFPARERVDHDYYDKTPIKQDVADLLRNGPWLILFSIIFLLFAALSLRGAALPPYFNAYLRRPDLLRACHLCGLGAAIAGIVISQPLILRFGNRSTLMIALLLTAIFTASLFLLPATALGGAFVLHALACFTAGPMLPLLWSMMADVADFSECKSDRRATGLIFSGLLLAVKAGLGLGGGLGGWLLASFGPLAGAGQSAQTLHGIRLCASILPVIPLLFGAACLVFFPIGERFGREIEDKLAGRRMISGLVVP